MNTTQIIDVFKKYSTDNRMDFQQFEKGMVELMKIDDSSISQILKNGISDIFVLSIKDKELMEQSEFEHCVDLIPMIYTTPIEAIYTALFKIVDSNNSGKINTSEFARLKKIEGEELSKKDLKELISKYDDNGDGKLNLQEWIAMFSE